MLKSIFGLFIFGTFAFFSSSTNYSLKSYSIGPGGTNTSSSSNYKAQANLGETAGISSSTNYSSKSGSIQAEQANVPPAPTLSTNGGTYYNQLGLILNTGGNPPSATFAVAVSSNNFANTYYVQSDGTLGATQYFQTYIGWGGASGTNIVGLAPSTVYEVKVSAMDGTFTQSEYGPYASASTTVPSITFSLSPSSQNIGTLLPGSIITSPSTVNFSISTNADNGADIYVTGQYAGLYSNYSGNIIPAYSGDLSSTAHGFGLQDTSETSPLTAQSPYNGSGTVVGSISPNIYASLFSATSPISSGLASVSFEAKSEPSDISSSDYSEVLTFLAAADY